VLAHSDGFGEHDEVAVTQPDGGLISGNADRLLAS
jgi:hypothetical protein